LSSARRGRASTPSRTSRGRQRVQPPRLRILFLASQFPYPADSGATIKTLSIIDYLRRRHDLRMVSFAREPLTEAQERWSLEIGGMRTLRMNRGRSPWNLVRSYASRVPLGVERNRNPEMKKLIDTEVAEFQPDVVFVDGLVMAQYLPPVFPGVKLLHEHNAEHQLWERQAAEENGARRPVVAREAARVRRYEASVIPQFDTVFAVSEEDRRALRELGAEYNKLRVLPNIPDRALLDRPSPRFADTEPLILYFATLSWQPNIEGILRLLKLPLAQIVKQVPEARLLVAGKGAPDDLRKRVESTPNAEFVGEVDDPETLYQRSRVLVDASTTGGGTRLKILNALARGVPVVASSEAARGLDIVAGEHMVVARNEHMLIEAVVTLLQDPDRWRIQSENGRALVRAKYVPETAFRELDEVLARATAPGE